MATFTNQATLTYNSTTTNSNIVTGQLLAVLSATKTAVSPEYASRGDVTFVITIVNAGTTPYAGLTVTDNLGEYTFGTSTRYPLSYKSGSLLYFIDGVLQTAPTVDTTIPPLTITGISVPAGGNATLVYEAEANQFAPLGPTDSITNTATITGGGLSTPVTAMATIRPVTGPALTITKAITPVPVTENGRLTYTFTIQNTSNTAAAAEDGVFLTDLFDPILSDVTVALNGIPWAEGTNYTYDAASGLFATVPGQITVPAASFTQDPTTGAWSVTPGVSVLTVTGTV